MSCIDTLRLTGAQRSALVRTPEKASREQALVELRRDVRFSYAPREGVELTLFHPGGSSFDYRVWPHNISRGGLALLHGTYVHPGSRVQIRLPTLRGEPQEVEGGVVWCRHVHARIHEVGVKFTRMIDLARFLPAERRAGTQEAEPTPAPERPSPADEPEADAVDGRVLVVEPDPDERALLLFHLRSLRLAAQATADAFQTFEHMEAERFDLILTAAGLPGMTGLELTEVLRSGGYDSPVLILTDPEDQATRSDATTQGASGFIDKPCRFDQLASALVTHLPILSGEEPPLYSNHWPNPKMRPLIEGFVGRLEERVRAIQDLEQDPSLRDTFHHWCLKLALSADAYGYPPLAGSARALSQAVAEDDPDATRQAADGLRRLCSAAAAAVQMDEA